MKDSFSFVGPEEALKGLHHSQIFTHLTNVWKHIECPLWLLTPNPLDPIQTIDDNTPPFLKRIHHAADSILAERRLQGKASTLLIVRRDAGEIVDIEIPEDFGFLHGGEEGPSNSPPVQEKLFEAPLTRIVTFSIPGQEMILWCLAPSKRMFSYTSSEKMRTSSVHRLRITSEMS